MFLFFNQDLSLAAGLLAVGETQFLFGLVRPAPIADSQVSISSLGEMDISRDLVSL